MDYTDAQLLYLYEAWSEEYYAAGFTHPSEGTVRQFIKWLKEIASKNRIPVEDYEFEMLEIARRILNED